MDDKQKLSDFLLIKLQECKLKPHDGAIYGEAADYIAEQLVVEGYCKPCDVVSVAKDKEKQLEEIAKLTCEVVFGGHNSYEDCGDCFGEKDKYFGCKGIAESYYAADYSKQSDVVKEFVLQLIERFENTETIANCIHGRSNTEINRIIKIVAAEFGTEVEE